MTDDGFFTDDFVEEDAHWFAAGGTLRRNGLCSPADRVVQQRRGTPRPGGRLRLSHLPQQGLSPCGDRRGGDPERLDAALPVPEGPPEHPADAPQRASAHHPGLHLRQVPGHGALAAEAQGRRPGLRPEPGGLVLLRRAVRQREDASLHRHLPQGPAPGQAGALHALAGRREPHQGRGQPGGGVQRRHRPL